MGSFHVEGPYDPGATIRNDTLLAALDQYDVPVIDNVWADVATLWRQLLTQPRRLWLPRPHGRPESRTSSAATPRTSSVSIPTLPDAA